MRDEVKTRVSGAGAALATSITLAAYQGGHLGSGLIPKQVTATLAVIPWIPYMQRTSIHKTLPKALFVSGAGIWFCTCVLPSFVLLVVNLFTGHRTAGSQWYHSLWRVFAILGLWMGFAVLNERVIRPWWRESGDALLAPLRHNSVGNQAKKIAEGKRDEALGAIKARMVATFKKKKLAERSIGAKKNEIVIAQESMQKAEKMLEKAKKRAESAAPDDEETAKEEVNAVASMVESSRCHKKGLYEDIERAKLDVQETEPQIEALKHEWAQALHIENYTQFYR